MTLASIAARAWEIADAKGTPDSDVKSDGGHREKRDSWAGRLARRVPPPMSHDCATKGCDAVIAKTSTYCRACYLAIMRRKKAG